MNVPVKTGACTFEIIERQLGRVGLTSLDLVSGTGDGGGENEGTCGIHALIEICTPSYVRRRCFAHLPWRVANAGLQEIPHQAATEAICTYLRDGVTWTRLHAIATQMRNFGVRAMEEFFRTSPPALIEDRPECVVVFLAWLLPRHERLAELAQIDMQQRDLKFAAAATALASLQNRSHVLRRHVDAVMLHKTLYLWYANQKTPWLVEQGLFQDIIKKASQVIMNKGIDEHVLQLFKITAVEAAHLADRRLEVNPA